MVVRIQLFEDFVPGMNITRPVCQLGGVYGGLPPQMFKIKDLIAILFRSFLPIAIIVPANIVIIIKLLRQKRARSSMTSTVSQNHEQTSKTTWMVVWASLAYVITVTPISIYQIYMVRHKITGHTDLIIPFLSLIFRINPALNFYIYFLSGGLFKKEMKNWMGLNK